MGPIELLVTIAIYINVVRGGLVVDRIELRPAATAGRAAIPLSTWMSEPTPSHTPTMTPTPPPAPPSPSVTLATPRGHSGFK